MGTWLPGAADPPASAAGLEGVLGRRPDLAEPFREFYAVFWRDRLVDPVVLELCRLRVAQLLGCESEAMVRYRPALDAGLGEAQVGELARWPTSPAFDDAQRAALAFAEQFVIDPQGIRGPIRDELRRHFPLAEVVALTEALALFDGFTRFRLVLGTDGPLGAPVVVDPAALDAPLP